VKKLKANSRIKREGPLVLIIMDGIGIGRKREGDAFLLGNTPVLDRLKEECMNSVIYAHGTFVGLPGDGDMGNSEVGHNALGAGRIFDQGAKLVSNDINSGKIFGTDTWKELIEKPVNNNRALHFIGLLSDGNVHSHINHLFSMIERAVADGVKKVRVHILLDGRDVGETSALEYVEKLETVLEKQNDKGCDCRIASGGGRMVTTMDRYEADWHIVKKGWLSHVVGTSRPFKSAGEAIETYRQEENGITDQYLPSFTIVDDSGPVGVIEDGDSVIFFNFRGDRAIEITKAFEDDDFPHFDRIRKPDVVYAGMMEYDGDLKIPKKFLVHPPHIDNTVSEYLAETGVKQYAISETQKFGHVTYFWNGNRTEKFNDDLESYFEVPSDRIEFNQRPWMKAAEITDKVIEVVQGGEFRFIRLNYANGDMVGHTGDLDSAIIAGETVDLCVGRLLEEVEKKKGIAVITADHGNLEEMFEINKKSGDFKIEKKTGKPQKKTSHTTNQVPFIIFDPGYRDEYRLAEHENPGLANVAATLLMLLGYDPPDGYMPSLIKLM
jgi:2,3-bisphosphoglycerate-independent phosphoglycerate mutase